MNQWLSLWDGASLPDWKDFMRPIQTYTDGVIATGILSYEDFGSDGGGGEYPIWQVLTDGEPSSLYDCEFYRFMDGRVA